MKIDVEITLGLQIDVDQAVARELFQHVVQETDAGGDLIIPLSVEIYLDRDLGFLGVALDARAPLSRHGILLGLGGAGAGPAPPRTVGKRPRGRREFSH